MRDSKQIVYRLCAQTVLLLVWYAALSLLAAVKFLPHDPLASALPYSTVSGAANVLLHLTLVTGLLAAGLYIARVQLVAHAEETSLTWVWRGWTLFLLVSGLAAVLGVLEGRTHAELPFLLDVIECVLLLAWLGVIVGRLNMATLFSTPRESTQAAWNSVLIVWAVGLLLCVGGIAVTFLPVDDLISERALTVLALGLRDTLGLGAMGFAAAFWVLTRVSNAATAWIEGALLRVVGVFLLAGALTSASQVMHLPHGIQAAGIAGAVLSVWAAVWLVAHSYRALSNRAPIQTLAAHWTLLGIILMSSASILGAVLSVPIVQTVVQGTQLTVLLSQLSAMGLLAWLLAFINQAVAEIRGQNFRITGLVPFWCIAVGLGGGSVAFFGAGVVQVYLERLMSIGYLETQAALVPLYVLWIVGLLLFAPGVVFYALGFRARRADI